MGSVHILPAWRCEYLYAGGAGCKHQGAKDVDGKVRPEPNILCLVAVVVVHHTQPVVLGYALAIDLDGECPDEEAYVQYQAHGQYATPNSDCGPPSRRRLMRFTCRVSLLMCKAPVARRKYQPIQHFSQARLGVLLAKNRL